MVVVQELLSPNRRKRKGQQQQLRNRCGERPPRLIAWPRSQRQEKLRFQGGRLVCSSPNRAIRRAKCVLFSLNVSGQVRNVVFGSKGQESSTWMSGMTFIQQSTAVDWRTVQIENKECRMHICVLQEHAARRTVKAFFGNIEGHSPPYFISFQSFTSSYWTCNSNLIPDWCVHITHIIYPI